MMGSARRYWRWCGGLALLGAIVMLVLGQTVLHERLQPVWFLCYWSLCFLFTILAMLAAFMDLRGTRLQSYEQHRELLENTLSSIEETAIRKRSGKFKEPSRNGRP